MRGEQLPDKLYFTTSEAARVLSISDQLFSDLAAEYTEWCHPVLMGTGKRKVKRWHRDDVWCLGHVLRQRMVPKSEGCQDESEEAE